MQSAHNVILRGAVYHFRRRIPEDIKGLFGRDEITRSLRTSDLREAARRSRAMWLNSEAAFREVARLPGLSRTDIDAALRRWLDDRLWEAERQVTTMASFVGVPAPVAPPTGLTSDGQGTHGAGRAASCPPETSNGEEGIGRVARGSAAGKRVDGGQASGGKRFKALWAEFSQAMVHEGGWTGHTAAQSGKSMALWLDFAGDLQPTAYGRATAADFRRVLSHLPADYGKAAKWRGMPLRALVARAEAEGVTEVLTLKTVVRHMSALSSFWTWLVENGRVPKGSENIFAGFGKGRRKSLTAVRAERAMWEPGQLRALFATPVWTGCLSAERRNQPGPHVIRDDKFWVPLIGLFTGMRLEEICQLLVEDVRSIEGIWVFDVRAGAGRHLKNDDSVRLVPIHRDLLRLGLIEQLVAGRASGHRLFTALTEQGADGKLGIGFTKWFCRYRKLTGVYDERRDFHSLRHTVTTLLVNAGAHPVWLDELIGHANPGRRGESGRYTKAIWLGNLRDTIELLNPEVDLSALMPDGAGEGRVV